MLQVNLPSVRQAYKNWDGGGLEKGWEKLLSRLSQSQDAPQIIPLETILDAGGLDDASIALQAVKGHARAIRLFACYCAGKAVPLFEKHYPQDLRLREALAAAEQYARGLSAKESLKAARKSLKEIRKDLVKAHNCSNYELEQLHYAFNPVAACLNARFYTYAALPGLNLGQVGHSIRDSQTAFSYFIKAAGVKEDKNFNEALNDEGPLEAFFASSYTLPAFETVNNLVRQAAEAAMAVMASEAADTLRKNAISPPPSGDLKEAAWASVKGAVTKAALASVCHIAVGALNKELTDEFRRLCRLDGRYGETEATDNKGDNL